MGSLEQEQYDDWLFYKMEHDAGRCNSGECELCYSEMTSAQQQEIDKEREGEIPF